MVLPNYNEIAKRKGLNAKESKKDKKLIWCKLIRGDFYDTFKR
jgi:hypothetical protein